MAKFEATYLLPIAFGRGRKPVSVDTEEIVKETIMESTHGTCCRTLNERILGMMYKVVSKVLNFYSYKIKNVQELQGSKIFCNKILIFPF